MSIKKNIITVLLFLQGIFAFSQSGHLYTINEGLSSTEICQILQDYKGFIWIATNNGLNRFDGLQFSVYSLTDKWDRTMHDMDITCLFEDENKVLYVGTTKGLWRYNRKHDIFDKITGCDLNGTFTSYHVKKIIRSGKYGLLVATSGHKILRLNGNKLDYIGELDDKLESKYINNIYEDSQGNLYVNAENSGTCIKRYNSKTYDYIASQSQGFVEGFLYGNTKKDVIINTNKGIYGIDGSKKLYLLETGQMGKIKGVCSAKNRTWIYTLDGKIAFYDENESLTSYDDPVLNNVLLNNRIELLYEDSFHNLWIVLKNKGIFMKSFADNSLLNFFMPNQKSLCVYSDNDEVMVNDSIPGPLDMSSVLSDKKLSILIADDEKDIRKYLRSELCMKYNIIECGNGKQALEEAVLNIPDLIICDIMMPEIDGITLCKKIRSNYNISHLPIILLTAMINTESIQEGIAAGADDYITKPFNMNLLEIKIRKLIEMRSNLQHYYSNDVKFEIKEGNNISPDEKLQNKIKEVMKVSLSNPELNVDFLSREVGYSRVHLNRKMKELFNMSAHEYIKVTRMKQATVLLKENKLNISEVAYAVGYTNHAHFSACFKEFYGKTPREYINDADK